MAWVAVAIGGSAVVGAIASERASSRAAAATQGASDAAGLQAQIAAEQWDKYKELYEPLEKDYIKEAQAYDTPEQYAKAAGEASATVSDQFSKARDRLTRTPGLDPSTAGYASNMVGLDLAQAATDATQQNAARQKVKDTAYARKTDALSLGKGLPAQASSSLSNAATTQAALASSQNTLAGQQAAAVGQLFSPNNLLSLGKATSKWLNNGTNNTGSLVDTNTYSTDIPVYG